MKKYRQLEKEKNVFFRYFNSGIPNVFYMRFFRKCSMFHRSILLKNTFDKLKTKFTTANSKLSDRLINVEKKGFANEQYSRRECLEISGIPPIVSTRKFYIRRNNNEVDSIETRRIVIAHFLP